MWFPQQKALSSGDSWPTHVLHGKVESFAVSFQKGARRNTSSTMLTLQRKTNHIQVLWYQTETSWARLPTCGRSWMLINAKEDSNVATNNWSPECCQHAIESCRLGSGSVPTVVWLLLKLWFESGLPSFLPSFLYGPVHKYIFYWLLSSCTHMLGFVSICFYHLVPLGFIWICVYDI